MFRFQKYETKDLTRYVDHLYEHYQRNSLMIPDSPLTPDNFTKIPVSSVLTPVFETPVSSSPTPVYETPVYWNTCFQTYETKDLTRYVDHLYEHFLRNSLMIPSFEEILTELRRRETVTGSETWRREFWGQGQIDFKVTRLDSRSQKF